MLLENHSRNHKGLIEFLGGTFPWQIEENIVIGQSGTKMREVNPQYILDRKEIPKEAIGVTLIGPHLMYAYLFHPQDTNKQPQLLYREEKQVDVARVKLKPNWKELDTK